jgi:hypothetical protein
MKMQEVIVIAKKWNIPFKVGLSKEELIRSIQKKEGYTDCFRRDDSCEEQECLWKDDCFSGK